MDKFSIKIPQSIYDVPLRHYQEFQKIIKATEGDESRGEFLNMKLVSIFGSVDIDSLRKIQYSAYSEAVGYINQTLNQPVELHLKIEIDNRQFGFIPNLESMTMGEYVDIDKYIRDDADYHRLMAVLYRPITITAGDTYDIEEYQGSDKYSGLMKDLGLGYALGAMLFFYDLMKELLIGSLNYSQEDLMTILQEKGDSLPKDGGGINHSTILQAVRLLNSTVLQNYHSPNA